jgi:hypothetical protein
MPLRLQPVTFRTACAFVAQHHSHHKPPRGWKFGVGVADGDRLVGVAMVGRPVARHLDDGRTLEVLRCCSDGTARNVASKLYSACWRAARALGYQRLITYTLAEETGTSLRAASWRVLHQTRGGSWGRPGRPRQDQAPTGPKTCWLAGDVAQGGPPG